MKTCYELGNDPIKMCSKHKTRMKVDRIIKNIKFMFYHEDRDHDETFFCHKFFMFGHVHIFFFIITNVACAIDPKVNTFRVQFIFHSTPNFCNLCEFLATKFTKRSISSTP